jgi:PAS domain-containing protein
MAILDITEKKETEEKLRLSASVFEHAAEATMISDENNVILAVNPAFTTIRAIAPRKCWEKHLPC